MIWSHIAQELTVDTDGDGTTDIWGIQLPGPWTTGFEYWVGAAGGSLISEDGETFVGYHGFTGDDGSGAVLQGSLPYVQGRTARRPT